MDLVWIERGGGRIFDGRWSIIIIIPHWSLFHQCQDFFMLGGEETTEMCVEGMWMGKCGLFLEWGPIYGQPHKKNKIHGKK